MTDDIVILGGGTGGSVLANDLAERLGPEIDTGEVRVRLLNDGPDHVYKPVWLYVPFGKREPADGRRPLRELVDNRIEIEDTRVTEIDTDAKQLRTNSGQEVVEYDHLVVGTGSTLAADEVPGLQAAGHDFYSEEGSLALREELLSFTEGHLVLSVIGSPHMCPAAPLEFVFMTDDWFRQRGLREDIEITYTYPIQRVHGNSHIAEWARPLMDERDINVETFFNAESVDPETGVLESMEGTGIDADLLVAIPPHRGVDIVEDAGLGDRGWVAVDKHTLEADHADDVYALGDAADTGVPKAGSVAHYQAATVGQRLASEIRGQQPTARYDGKTICFIETGMDTASFVEFDYQNPPSPISPSQSIHWSKLAYNESYWLTARGLI